MYVEMPSDPRFLIRLRSRNPAVVWADRDPRGIELRAPQAELRRARERVVVVVQALAAGQPGQHARVVCGVLEVLAAPPVPEAVDQRRQDEHIDDAVAEHGHDALPPADPEHHQRRAKNDARPAAREHAPLPSIRSQVGRERLDGLGLPGLADVVVHVPQLHLPEAQQERAVRIAVAIDEGVVLPVHRNPLLLALTRQEPEHGAEQERRDRLQSQRAVRERAVQIDRCRERADLSQHERSNHDDQDLASQRFFLFLSVLGVTGMLCRTGARACAARGSRPDRAACA